MSEKDYVTRNEFNQVEKRVGKVEDRMTRSETEIKHVKDTLKSIQGDTRWILRLVIGAFIMAVLGLIFKGGI